MTLVMVVTRPMEGKTNRNAIIVPVTTSPETRGVGESNRLAENDASCEMSEPDRTKEQVDGSSTFIPPTRSDFKVLSGIVEKILTSEQKSNSTLKKKKSWESIQKHKSRTSRFFKRNGVYYNEFRGKICVNIAHIPPKTVVPVTGEVSPE